MNEFTERYIWRSKQDMYARCLFDERYTNANDRDFSIMWALMRMSASMTPAQRISLLDGI
jgi:hypothetical protein